MPKLDLESDVVFICTTEVNAARAYFDGMDITEVVEDFDTTLDNAQAKAQETGKAYLVIEITKETSP